MSESNTSTSRERSLAKGLAAGLVAGLVGVAAKTLAERMFQHRSAQEAETAGDWLANHSLLTATNHGQSIPWEFGAFAGAAYGALAEFYPAATAREGAAFGMAVETLTHEVPLPALGISLPVGSESTRERVSGMTSHVIFGVTVEFVRRIVRKVL